MRIINIYLRISVLSLRMEYIDTIFCKLISLDFYQMNLQILLVCCENINGIVGKCLFACTVHKNSVN